MAVDDAQAAISQVAGPSTRSSVTTCWSTCRVLTACSSTTAEVATPNAVLSMSIRNARHISLLCDLIVHGTFGYPAEKDTIDTTHLRWLTRKDLIALLRETSSRVAGLRSPQDPRRYRSLKFAAWLVQRFGVAPARGYTRPPGTRWRPATSRTTKCHRKRA